MQLKINAELKEQVYLCYIPFRMSFYFTVKDAERENSTSLLVFSPQNWIPSQLPQRSKVFAAKRTFCPLDKRFASLWPKRFSKDF